uniref:MMS19 nucleotide excision repair protein n=1 Tax=Aceria tosichella TaxID=561515 RepID=A0A6G1S678_9ACAR
MEFNTINEKLSVSEAPNDMASFITTSANQVAEEIRKGGVKIIDLIKGLNAILTNSSYEIRSRGVELLVQVITALPTNQLTEKEIELLTEFICLRLIDHKSMENAALRGLSYFADCDHKPMKYNKQVMEFIKTKANIHKMEAKSRYTVYELLKKFVIEKKRITNSMNGEFIYSLVTILEGENNPENLILCFGMITFILKNFDDLEPYIDDIFEWLTSYYPVDYTPIIDRNQGGKDAANFVIQRSDLVDALYECFYATDLNADNLQALLLEKVDSNVLSSQLESLECLIKCYEKPFPLSSVSKYNSTLWTAIRMNCLKKIEGVDAKLLDTSLRTLTALAKRLSEDKDMYFTFITDMYEELAIAFRKPEMELFEPAARLLTHSILPSLVGFNFVLGKILPISLNALEANELRPLPGLAYMFSKLHQQHPQAKLESNLDPHIAKLAVKVADLTQTHDRYCVTLLEALIRQQVTLDTLSLTRIIDILQAQYGKSSLDIEKCLALICSNYNIFSIITDANTDGCDLNSLLRLIYQFDSSSIDLGKFSIYLRLLKLELVASKGTKLDSLDQLVLNDSLTRLRGLLPKIGASNAIVEKSAFIHAVVLNKLEAKNANQISMSIFSSNYCQGLISAASNQDSHIARNIYLPHIKWTFKSLVLRNHQLATPLINLVLNCIISEKVDCDLAYDAAKTFEFVLTNDEFLESGCHYQIFSLYKQKFYMQTNKEIRLRLEQQQNNNDNGMKKSLLIYAIVSQLAHLPIAVFKRDHEWLVRQLLRFLSTSPIDSTSEQNGDGERNKTSSALFYEIYKCLECLIQKDLSNDALVSFLPSIIDLNLKNAQQAKSMEVRRQALMCLAKVATSFKESDLLVYRTNTIDKLRHCLTDKKRLVRQAAGEARLRWVLIGQPIGS